MSFYAVRKLEIDIPVPVDEIPGGTDSDIFLSLKGEMVYMYKVLSR